MNILQIEGLEQGDKGYLKDGEAMTNFLLQVWKVVADDGSAQFGIQILADACNGRKLFTSSKIRRQRFLQEFPVYIADEKAFYKLLRDAIFKKEFAKEELMFQTASGGLHKVDGKWMFVFANSAIDKQGFREDVHAEDAWAYFPPEALLQQNELKRDVELLFGEYNINPKVFYPFFLFNAMSISNAYFREIGEPNFMKLTLWLDGVSGSGKTELAKAAGTYVFESEKFEPPILSATCKRKYIMEQLAQSSGAPLLFDDVKKERASGRRDSVRNIIDDILRSVFQGRLTDVLTGYSEPPQIDTCAIITGEYMDTNESQNARLMYLRVDGFLKDKRNSEALRALQEHPLWLTSVCGGYIQWLIKKLEESSFSPFLKAKLKELRNSQKASTGINNAERLNENRIMLQMAALLTELYFKELGMSAKFMECFSCNVKQSIQALCDDTFYLLGGKEMVVLTVMERIFSKYRVRKAHYQQCLHPYNRYTYWQPYFWIWTNDDFVWIEEYEKSLLRGGRGGEHEQLDEPPFLLVREARLIELFQRELESLSQERQVSSAIMDKLPGHLMQVLKKMQVIYQRPRSDSELGRSAANYPVCTLDSHYNINDGEWASCMVSEESTIRMNVNHPSVDVLKKRLDDPNLEEEYPNVRNWSTDDVSMDDVFKVRRSFANVQKSLYRE